MMRYSNSSLNVFEQCKMKFKFQYVDSIKREEKSIDAFMGSCVHKAMELLYRDLMNGKTDSLEKTIGFYEREWDRNYDEGKIINRKTHYTADDFRNVGRKCVTDYYNSHKPFDDMNIISVESKDYLVLPGGYEYHVIMDKFACKGDTFYVCDYKTNSSMKTQEEADSDRQLALYSAWVRQKYNTDKVKLVWHMVRFDHDVVSERTEEQLEELMQSTSELIREIESCNEWPTTTSALCSYCEYRDICPEFGHVVKIEKEIEKHIYTEDEGAKLVDEYAELEKKRSELREQLKPIEEEQDGIKAKIAEYAKQFGYSTVAGFEKQAKVKWEKKAKISDEKLADVLAAMNRDGSISQYQKLDKMRVEKDIAGGKLPELSEYAECSESPKVTFSGKK